MANEHEKRPITTWGELFTRTLELGLGAATLTVDAAQKVVNDLVGRGEVTREEGATLLDRLLAMGREQREQIADMVDKGTARALERMDLARRSDMEALRRRVADLEKAVLGYSVTEEPIAPMHDTEMQDNE